MKKLQKITGYILATVVMFLASQFSVLAAGGPVNNNSSLSAFQVIGGLVILLFFILVPLMKGVGKHITVDKK
jgi:succinate dehydrogenase/fumarate reductase cytochrome b subunit